MSQTKKPSWIVTTQIEVIFLKGALIEIRLCLVNTIRCLILQFGRADLEK